MPRSSSSPNRSRLAAWLRHRGRLVERALAASLPRGGWPLPLVEAASYSLLGGGKRLRPLLAVASCEACGGHGRAVMAAACALEHVHTYSLIHDDLPAMDDDDFRRGRPTSHKVFGEAEAILAGDALLTRAFELVVSAAGLDPAVRCRMVRELAVAAGGGGMVGGQWDDIRAEGRPVDEAAVLGIHRRKTGALIRAALRLGAMAAGASPAALGRLTRYGESLGALFQIVDDILDVEGTMEEMGKTPGSDVRRGKATYPAVAGMERARAEAARHATEALDALRSAGPAAWVLREMVTLVRERRG